MKLRRTLTCTFGFVGLHVAIVSPASAAVEIRADNAPVTAASLSSDTSVAGLAGPPDSRCARPIQPALGAATPAVEGLAVSKASAILGGQLSRLELIALQQAGTGPSAMADRKSTRLNSSH